MRELALVVVLALSLGTAVAQSTSAKRGAASLGNSLSEWADRQAALNAEIELAKAKAEIELDKQKKLQALQRQQQEQKGPTSSKVQPGSSTNIEQEEAKMSARHPQWVLILNSSAFGSWLGTRSLAYQQVCRSTQSAEVMVSCIDDFFKTKIIQAQ